jgi:GH25 family lysozyme M1 (1,4-beta-N-acetylmuramidase)
MYPVWYAFYNNYMYYPYPVRMWQYSTDGAVPGIKVNVDMNVWMTEPEADEG